MIIRVGEFSKMKISYSTETVVWIVRHLKIDDNSQSAKMCQTPYQNNFGIVSEIGVRVILGLRH